MNGPNTEQTQALPGIAVSSIPVICLIGLMMVNFRLGEDAIPGAIIMFLCAVLAALLGRFYCKIPYKTLESGILKAINMSMPAILIIFLVGALISMWITAGVVPMLIYYGLEILSPKGFLVVCCLISCVAALCTGSSWSTVGTVGLALMGVGTALGIPEEFTAGAIISGAYFGDKMSPMSDSTNLAPAMVGIDVFTHIRHMMYTSVPAIIVALLFYFFLGLFYQGEILDNRNILLIQVLIIENFNTSLWLLIIPAAVIFGVVKGLPPIPALTMGIFLAIAAIPVFQGELLARQLGGNLGFASAYSYIFNSIAAGFSIDTGNALIDKLFNRGGMLSMLELNFLVIAAMAFGGLLETSGMLAAMTNGLLRGVRSVAGLISTTLGTCIFVNFTAANQTMAIIIPARMFAVAYKERNLHPKNLSRACEDAGTVFAPLVPWNTNGVYCAGVLGVSTLSYAPFAVFCLVSPLVSLVLGLTGKTIAPLDEGPLSQADGADTVAIVDTAS